MFYTDAQLDNEIKKCEYCEEKPCTKACPADCSPADFIMAAKKGADFDYKRAAGLILSANPLGWVCGTVCPTYHCMKACTKLTFDRAVNIPKIQATIIHKAKMAGCMPTCEAPEDNGHSVAIVGAGPAGLGAAAILAQKGYRVTLFEKAAEPGGMCLLIPESRLDNDILRGDFQFLMGLGHITLKTNHKVEDITLLLEEGFDAVIISTGLDDVHHLGMPGEEAAITWMDYLKNHKSIDVKGKRVAIMGGGAVAIDCGITAKQMGASNVDLIYRRNISQMPITPEERRYLWAFDLGVITRTIITGVEHDHGKLTGLNIVHVDIPNDKPYKPEHMIKDSETRLIDYDYLILAVGSHSTLSKVRHEKIFYAGDVQGRATTVVEAVASGKNAALKVDAFLMDKAPPVIENDLKCKALLAGYEKEPVSLETDFFGLKIRSPFLLAAGPATDGYDQIEKAYEAGWAGAVVKTSFDNVPIHIPADYISAYGNNTFGNCDNVSEHPLDKMCDVVRRLVQKFPDRLTIGGTGGPVTGDDAHDKAGWQSNTKKLEAAGAMALEYSLSCPQGGDGTEGAIVSQNAKLTAKIIDWVMEVSDPDIPKLFKLTGAVTSLYPILDAIRTVFEKYPNKKAGVTLANSFPAMEFRQGTKPSWEEGVMVGMSGECIKHISYLALAQASRMEMTISGNGGPMDYKAAAHFLALGTKTVQFCAMVMQYGVHIIDELCSGLSHLMQARGMQSMDDLIGCALPDPITDFMDLSPVKRIAAVVPELCEHCGNCTRCGYQAITLDDNKVPVIDPKKCVGCSLCTQKCFAWALYMRDRVEGE